MSTLKTIGKVALGGWALFTVVVNVGSGTVPQVPVLSSVTPVLAQNGLGDIEIVSHSSFRLRNTVSNILTGKPVSQDVKTRIDEVATQVASEYGYEADSWAELQQQQRELEAQAMAEYERGMAMLCDVSGPGAFRDQHCEDKEDSKPQLDPNSFSAQYVFD